jgi:putative PIN family toxin of toxin-antitoxin system
MGPKVVFDTDVWVSTLLKKSLSQEFVPLIENGMVTVCVSRPLLHELARVLTYPKLQEILRAVDVSENTALATVVKSTVLVRPRHVVREIVKDPSDNRVLECALSCKAKTVVSGDRHLLELERFRGIEIMAPREFLDRTASGRRSSRGMTKRRGIAEMAGLLTGAEGTETKKALSELREEGARRQAKAGPRLN